MSLGLCCQWIEARTKRTGETIYENILDEKSLQLGAYKNGKYDGTRILDTYRGNVKEVLRIIPKLNEHNIKSFRLSSSLFPLYEFCGDIARNDAEIKSVLQPLLEEERNCEDGSVLYDNTTMVQILNEKYPTQLTILYGEPDYLEI